MPKKLSPGDQYSLKRSLRFAAEYNDILNNYSLQTIADIKFKVGKDEIEFIIKTHRPGVFIGVHGSTIDVLEAYINKVFTSKDKSLQNLPVKIILEDASDIWK